MASSVVAICRIARSAFASNLASTGTAPAMKLPLSVTSTDTVSRSAVLPDRDTVKLAAPPSSTVTACAAMLTCGFSLGGLTTGGSLGGLTTNVSSSMIVIVAVAVPSDTPAGRLAPVRVTVKVSSSSASASPSVATVMVCAAVDKAANVSVCGATAV